MLRARSGVHGLHARRSGPGASACCPLWNALTQQGAGAQQRRAPPPAAPPGGPGSEQPRVVSGATASTSGPATAASSGPAMVPAATAAANAAAAPPPPVIRRSNVSLFDALKFNGPAPEIINGRLAMLGILIAAKGEAATGETALQLLQHGAPWQYALIALWVYASMVPILKGARHEAFGPFTPRAEFTNGRAAMLAWAILLALEHKAGVPFF